MNIIAMHLPQFHPIPENDEWWGKGFTEWTNTAKALPLFPGHYQPHVPADLGFYDLRLHEARVAQAELAQSNGVDTFCYYHYWFGGKLILQAPLEALLARDEPKMPFMICWANQTWTGIWHGTPDRTLIDQTYPGVEDERAHFKYLLQFFQDPRYLRIEGKPALSVYRPVEIPNAFDWTRLWQQMARENGLPGLYLVAMNQKRDRSALELGFDTIVEQRFPGPSYLSSAQVFESRCRRLLRLRSRPRRFDYEASFNAILERPTYTANTLPMILPNWDNTPRSGSGGQVLTDATPEKWRKLLRMTFDRTRGIQPSKRLVFVKSWNEWAEGNHLEPDLRYGCSFLDVLKEEVSMERGR